MSARVTALSKLRELPSWPDVCVLLDKLVGTHESRTELEIHLTLLCLQSAEVAEKRALDRVNDLVTELRGIVASLSRGAPAVHSTTELNSQDVTSNIEVNTIIG